MRTITIGELAKNLGIDRRTIWGWCQQDPRLAYKDPGVRGKYHIRLERLAQRPGMDLIAAFLLSHPQRWIKASVFSKKYKISPKTVGNWCRDHRKFAKRLGYHWYIDLDQLGCNEDQIQQLLLESQAKTALSEVE